MPAAILLAVLLQAGQAANMDPSAPIGEVLLAPLYDQPFACTEHPEGQLASIGDALGTDCMIVGGRADHRGFSTMYRNDGSRNEDWYGWHAELHAPFDGVVKLIHINPVNNPPGTLGKPPASVILFERADGVTVLFAHIEDARVKAGDHVTAGQVVALVGNNGMARNPHTHVGAFKGREPLQIRWDLRAEGKVKSIAGQ